VTAAEGDTSEVTIALVELPKPAASAVDALAAPPPSAPAKRGVPVWAWAVGGAGIALGAAAVGLRVDWARIDSKQQAAGCGPSLQSCPRSYTSLTADNTQKDRDRALFIGLGAASLVGIGAGVIGAVTGVVKKSEPRSGSVRAAPLLSEGTRGVAIEGSF
jgi:hypothetical protein